MALIEVGATAPPVPGVAFGEGPVALWFYKVTCPVCQMAAPVFDRLADAFPGRVAAVGQDPPGALEAFGREWGVGVEPRSDLPPYEVSEAYGLEAVPSLVLVGEDGSVLESVQSWDREGYNRVAARLSELTGAEPVAVSEPNDGLPEFRPG